MNDPEFFRQNGTDEIRMCFRKKEKLLPSLSETATKPTARRKRQQALPQLPAACGTISFEIQKCQNAIKANGILINCDAEQGKRGGNGGNDINPTNAAHKQHQCGDRSEQRRGSEIGFEHQQDTKNADARDRSHKAFEKALFTYMIGKEVRKEENKTDFRRFGWLETQIAASDPAARTFNAATDPGNKHRQQQSDRQ